MNVVAQRSHDRKEVVGLSVNLRFLTVAALLKATVRMDVRRK